VVNPLWFLIDFPLKIQSNHSYQSVAGFSVFERSEFRNNQRNEIRKIEVCFEG